MLWMDEILHHPRSLEKPCNELTPLQIPTNHGVLWFHSGGGFRPPTVCLVARIYFVLRLEMREFPEVKSLHGVNLPDRWNVATKAKTGSQIHGTQPRVCASDPRLRLKLQRPPVAKGT